MVLGEGDFDPRAIQRQIILFVNFGNDMADGEIRFFAPVAGAALQPVIHRKPLSNPSGADIGTREDNTADNMEG